jgi:hypothetical protein
VGCWLIWLRGFDSSLGRHIASMRRALFIEKLLGGCDGLGKREEERLGLSN